MGFKNIGKVSDEMERYHIIKSIFGGSDVYDSNGNKVGYSLPSILGNGEDFYDMSGNYAGQSFESAFGGEWFSGPDEHGYMDQEFLMGENVYLDGDSFGDDKGTELSDDNQTFDFDHDE